MSHPPECDRWAKTAQIVNIVQDGHINKFIGDAVMAIFKGENHLERAIKAALAIKAQLSTAPEISAGNKTFQPKISIGINSGEMVSGNIGSVSLKRLDYTVIGDSVNTAQRLQSAAKPNQIFCEPTSLSVGKCFFYHTKNRGCYAEK